MRVPALATCLLAAACTETGVHENISRLTHADLVPITMMLACPDLTTLSPPLLEGSWTLELTARQDVTRISIPIAPRSALSDPGPIVITMTDTGL